MQGWFIPETQANFVVPPRRAQCGVHAGRPGGRADAVQYGNDGVRATIEQTEANDVLIRVAGSSSPR